MLSNAWTWSRFLLIYKLLIYFVFASIFLPMCCLLIVLFSLSKKTFFLFTEQQDFHRYDNEERRISLYLSISLSIDSNNEMNEWMNSTADAIGLCCGVCCLSSTDMNDTWNSSWQVGCRFQFISLSLLSFSPCSSSAKRVISCPWARDQSNRHRSRQMLHYLFTDWERSDIVEQRSSSTDSLQWWRRRG